MKVLQTIKYAYPSKGGMESVVKDIVEGVSSLKEDIEFTVYSSANIRSFVTKDFNYNDVEYIKEQTFGYFKSQPLTAYYKELGNLIDEHDIIHHHYPFPNMELNLLQKLKRLKNKKFVITWHANIGQSRWKSLESIYNPMVHRLLDRADSIVVTSPQLLEHSTLLSQYQSKIEVIPLSYSIKYTELDKPKQISLGVPLKILFVGRLREYKGISFLIHAIKNLDVSLSIVGNGEYGNILKQLVSELGIGDRVRFYHDLSDTEVESMYEKSDLFILPSINEAEAFGVVQLEAMAKGLPIINTSLKSGVPFVSLHNLTGLTVEPKDIQQLSNAILQIGGNTNMYERFSANAIERVKLFTRSKLALAYLNLYRK